MSDAGKNPRLPKKSAKVVGSCRLRGEALLNGSNLVKPV
jgi:hypothetical protein